MSSAEVLESPKEFAEGVIPLLKEYTQKLADITRAAREVWQEVVTSADGKIHNPIRSVRQADLRRLDRQEHRLRPAVLELARRVSQMLEHANLDSVHSVEMRLRLAELEHELEASRSMIQSANSVL